MGFNSGFKGLNVMFASPLSIQLKSNFKALFSRINRLRAVSNVIVLLAGRSDVGHNNANRLRAHGSIVQLAGRSYVGDKTLIACTRMEALCN